MRVTTEMREEMGLFLAQRKSIQNGETKIFFFFRHFLSSVCTHTFSTFGRRVCTIFFCISLETWHRVVAVVEEVKNEMLQL